MDTGKKIAKLRKQCNWTQAELAKLAGLSRVYIAKIEQGRRKPSIKTLVIIAAALGVGVDDIKEGE